MIGRARAPMGTVIYFVGTAMVTVYFVFAAIQGTYGVLRRAEVEAEGRALQAELARLETEVVRMENLTRRLSDTYLDLDLLDQRARDVLGMIRADEILIR